MVDTGVRCHFMHIQTSEHAQQYKVQKAPEEGYKKGVAPPLPSLKHENVEGGLVFFFVCFFVFHFSFMMKEGNGQSVLICREIFQLPVLPQ